MTYEQYEQAGFYRSAAEIIEDLERQLAAVTAEAAQQRLRANQAEHERDELRERLQRCEQDAEKKDKALNKARDLIDGFNAHPIRIGHCPGCDLIEAIDAALRTETK